MAGRGKVAITQAVSRGSDLEKMRDEVNNRAKRQLIRAINEQVANGTYPRTFSFSALDFVLPFDRLQAYDDQSFKLIEKAILELENV